MKTTRCARQRSIRAVMPADVWTVKVDVLERTLPGYVRPNFCDMILGSMWAE